MTSNRLSIHISSSDIYYENHNTGESIYTFLVDQQNEDKAFIPKKFAYRNSFEKYISNFLPAFSIDDVEKYDLYANKNSKYLYYRFNEYINGYGGKRKKIKHTQKRKDSIGLKKIEERNKQFLVEKIIHSVEFQNPYTNSVEQKPEIIDIVETNYKIARRVYQYLYLDIADLFQEFFRSLPPQDIQDMDDDIKSNGWGVRNILDIENSPELLNIFQTFYHTTGRLPLSNGHLIVPDGDAPAGENKVNMKSLSDMFRHTYQHGLVSLLFLGVIHYYFDATDQQLIKNALTELYGNLSYITLSGARDFEFGNISNLTARISFLIKSASRQNIRNREREDRENTYKINNDASFIPKSNDPLDVVLDIFDETIEHKKTSRPYVPPQVQTAPIIEIETQAIDNEFAKVKEQYDRVSNVAAEQKQTEELVDRIIKDKNLFQNVEIDDMD